MKPFGNLVARMRPHFRSTPRKRPAAAAATTPSPATQASAKPAPATTPAGPAGGGPAVAGAALAARNERLGRELAELQWDLGGLTYEMAIRDHFRVDLLVAQAARMQSVDAELTASERMAQLEQAGAAGTCTSCGAIYSRGAAFCWQCGLGLASRSQAPSVTAPQPAAPGSAAGTSTPAASPRPAAAPEPPPATPPSPTGGSRPVAAPKPVPGAAAAPAADADSPAATPPGGGPA